MKQYILGVFLVILLTGCNSDGKNININLSTQDNSLKQAEDLGVNTNNSQIQSDNSEIKESGDVSGNETFQKLNTELAIHSRGNFGDIFLKHSNSLPEKELKIDVYKEVKKLYLGNYNGEKSKYFFNYKPVLTSEGRLSYRKVLGGYLYLRRDNNDNLVIHYLKIGKRVKGNQIFKHELFFYSLYKDIKEPNFIKLYGENGLQILADNFYKGEVQDPQFQDALKKIEEKIQEFVKDVKTNPENLDYIDKEIKKLQIAILIEKKKKENYSEKKLNSREAPINLKELKRVSNVWINKGGYKRTGNFIYVKGYFEKGICGEEFGSSCYDEKVYVKSAEKFYRDILDGKKTYNDINFMSYLGRPSFIGYENAKYNQGFYINDNKNLFIHIATIDGFVKKIVFYGNTLIEGTLYEYIQNMGFDKPQKNLGKIKNNSFYDTYNGKNLRIEIINDFEDDGKFIDADLQNLHYRFSDGFNKYLEKESNK